MSTNATPEPRDSGDNRRRRNRGGSNNRNQNNSERRNHHENGGERRERRNDRGPSQGRRHHSERSEEFRPQAPRGTRAQKPVKLSFWQKVLKAIGLYKEPIAPARAERGDRRPESTPFPDSRAPKANTRNARSGDAEPRAAREPRQPRERRAEGEPRAERANRRGGDPKSVESTRVYVGNLSYDVSEQDLQELFKGIGGVRSIEIVYNRSTHRSKGYGFVEMLRMDEAMRAVEVLHDQPFMGRKMTVSGAKSKGQDEREDMEGRTEPEPSRVVLASTAPAVVVAAAAAVSEAPVEEIPVAVEAASTDLETIYSFDEAPSAPVSAE